MGLWRNIFGPSQDEVWSELATNLGGDFIKGGWLSNSQVVWVHNGTTVMLDTYQVSHGKGSSTYTRISAVPNSSPGFNVDVSKRGFFSGMGDMLGMQRIAIGDPAFDDKHIVKGQPVEKVKLFLSEPDLTAQIAAQPSIDFKIHVAGGGLFGGGKFDQILFHEMGVVKDLNRLKGLFAIFALALDRLDVMATQATDV